MGDLMSMPLLAVGAAFDFHAGTLRQAPPWMQGVGLEWAFRLWQEPKRLWRRYLYLNPAYVGLLARQALMGYPGRSPQLLPPERQERYG
jgi:UDP-N-acetyl-D-mannosaminuronic acid transferase (WecB/TagA/CpsF family)